MLLLGPLLARRGRARLAPPGGDFPARRTISTHLEALVSMGARMLPGPGHELEAPDGLKPASIYLYEASVTGTETALLAAAAPGVCEIRHAACEPHVVELCEFLRKLGVGVSGGGTTTIRVEGGAKLHGAEHRLWGDYIEAGSWAVVAAVTGGEIDVRGARAGRHGGRRRRAEARMNIECAMDGDVFRVSRSRPLAAGRITTGLWPGFPSDLVSLVTVLATQAEGTDARARLAVRAAAVRAGAVERHGRRSVSLRPAPHHRHRARSGCAAVRSTAATCDPGWR